MTHFQFLVIGILCLSCLTACSSTPEVRPTHWAQKVEGAQIRKLYKVDNHLYRSGLPNSQGMKQAEQLGIRRILNLHHFGNNDDEIRGTSLQVKQIRVRVTKMTYGEIVESLKYITRSKQPVLVHCLTGADRTGVVVAAYRMLKGWSKEDAMNEMVNGGFRFRKYLFPNLIPLVEEIDIQQLRKDVYS